MTRDLIYSIIGGIVVAVAAVSAGHALLTKRDPRAALGWMSACVLFPLIGPLFYFTFGINRIRMRAQKLIATGVASGATRIANASPEAPVPSELTQLERVGRSLTGMPLSAGNRVELLHSGEEAFPAMLAAIESAREEIVLATYIFDTNDTGRRFVDALAAARDRGVRVLVLIDGIGELYSYPWASRLLRKRSVRTLRFLPPRLLPPRLQVNLRNHRKVLVVDGETGFTGGINIGDRYLADRSDNPRRVVDLHARVTGPVVDQLRKAFAEDWRWLSGEQLPNLHASRQRTGAASCRVIADGPSENLEKIAMVLMAAISVATRRVCIMTPYFLPPRSLITALQAAALRGVDVRVVLPEKNNLPYVHWATRKMLWELLGHGVRVFLQPSPFVHTKLFQIDDDYVLLGSANIDPRSLRLNFELALEAYDAELAVDVGGHFDTVVARSKEVTLQEMDERSTILKMRDAIAWLASPYL